MNNLPNVWKVSPELSVKGPVLRSHRFNERYGTYMDFFECLVVNKGTLPATQFGSFAEIVNERNSNHARLQVWVAPGFFDSPSNPTFTQLTSKQQDINEFICEATVTEQVVQSGASLDSGPTVWESRIEAIDENHGMKRTITINEKKKVREGEFDQNLQSFVPIERELVYRTIAEADANFPAKLVAKGGTRHDYVSYEKVKCDWYVKTSHEMNTSFGYTSNEIRNGFWPAVLEQVPEIVGVEGVDENGTTYTVKQLRDVRIKDSYNGPCAATVVVGWSPTANPSVSLTQMLPDALFYEGILFNITIPECLHGNLTFLESVNNHPVYTTQTRSKSFTATNETDWPNEQQISARAIPYRGGFLLETVTISKPS